MKEHFHDTLETIFNTSSSSSSSLSFGSVFGHHFPWIPPQFYTHKPNLCIIVTSGHTILLYIIIFYREPLWQIFMITNIARCVALQCNLYFREGKEAFCFTISRCCDFSKVVQFELFFSLEGILRFITMIKLWTFSKEKGHLFKFWDCLNGFFFFSLSHLFICANMHQTTRLNYYFYCYWMCVYLWRKKRKWIDENQIDIKAHPFPSPMLHPNYLIWQRGEKKKKTIENVAILASILGETSLLYKLKPFCLKR